MNVHGIALAAALVLSQDSRTRRISAASAGVRSSSHIPAAPSWWYGAEPAARSSDADCLGSAMLS
jgi:hypothetical protein